MSAEDWGAAAVGVIAPITGLFTLSAMHTNNATSAVAGAVATGVCALIGLSMRPGLFGTVSGYTLGAAFALNSCHSSGGTYTPSTPAAPQTNTSTAFSPTIQGQPFCEFSDITIGSDGKAEKPTTCRVRDISRP
jgi:hypothetical protein